MARIVCQVLHRAERISFLWSEDAASFEPYHLEGAERANLLDVAAQIHAQLADGDARTLAQLGHRLYRTVFRLDAGDPGSAAIVQRWLSDQAVAGKVETLEFLSDVPGLIPWNVLIEHVPGEGDVWPLFFGARFRVAAGRRVNILTQNPVQVKPTQVMAADLDLVDRLGETQRPLLNPLREAAKLVHGIGSLADELKLQAPDVLSLLVRFEKGQLRLGADVFTLADLQTWLDESREGNPDPIILLMGCGDATEQPAWQALLNAASTTFSGVVANEALLPAAKAFAVGQAIAQRFIDGPRPLGEILQALRQEHGAAALAFSAFCPPQMRTAAEAPEETTLPDVALPQLPYRPFAAYDAADRALFFGREDATLRGALLVDHAATCGIVLHGSPAIGKTSYLQAGLAPFLEQDNIGYRILQDRSPVDIPILEDEYPPLILRATSDLAGQFADALAVFCAQPYTYTTPNGTQVTVDLPKILKAAATGAALPGATSAPSTAIQATESAGTSAPTPGEATDDDDLPHELWIALRDNPALLPKILDAITKALPFELLIAIDQGEELLTLVQSPQQRDRRAKALAMLMGLAGAVARCKVVFTIRTQMLGEFVNLLPGGQMPDTWRTFFLAPLAETDMAYALQLPTSREDIPYSSEIPHARYGFTFEDGAAQQIVADAIDVAAAEQQSPLAIIQAVGAILYDKQVLGKKQSTVGMNDVRQLGGVKQALNNCLDRSIERLKVSKGSQHALRHLISKLYVSHADGTLSRDVVAAAELKDDWVGSQEPVEPIVNHAADAEGLFEIQQLMIGGSTGVYVSLPQDSMAQLGRKIAAQRDLNAFGRTRIIDTLWIMIPLAFLTAAMSYFVTRNFISPGSLDDAEREQFKKEIVTEAQKFVREQLNVYTNKLEITRRSAYAGQLARANLALHGDNALRARQILLEEPASRNYGERDENKEGARRDLRGFDWRYLWKQLHPERYLYEGHAAPIEDVVISADQQLAASLSADGTIRIWSLARKESLALIKAAAPGPLRGLAISPDGKTLATGGLKNDVFLWDISGLKGDYVEISKETKKLSGHSDRVLALAFGKDSQTLASASIDKSIILWDLAKGQPKHTLNAHKNRVSSLAYSGDGKKLVSVDGLGSLIVWDAESAKKEKEIAGAEQVAVRIAVSADGTSACTAGMETDERTGVHVGRIHCWDLAAGKEARAPIVHSGNVLALALSPDGKSIASGGQDCVIRLWDLQTGKEKSKWVGHYGGVTALAFSKDGTTLVSGSYDAKVKVWNAAHSSGPDVVQAHADWVQCLALNKKNTLLASGSRDGKVKLWNPADGKEIANLGTQPGAVTALAFSHHRDKTFLAAATRDDKNKGAIQVWQIEGDAKTGYKALDKPALKGHTKGVTCLAFYPAPEKADILVSGSADHTVRVWNIEKGNELQEHKGHKDEVRSIAFGPEGRTFVSGGKDGQACLYVLDRKEITTFADMHAGSIESLALMPLPVIKEGFRKLEPGLLTGSSDHTMRLWVLDTDERGKLAPELYRHFRSHSQGISSVLFSDKGFGLSVSASWDGTIKLFDLDHERFTLEGHTGPVRAIVMAADQSFLASAGNDGTIRFWRADVASEPVKAEPK